MGSKSKKQNQQTNGKNKQKGNNSNATTIKKQVQNKEPVVVKQQDNADREVEQVVQKDSVAIEGGSDLKEEPKHDNDLNKSSTNPEEKKESGEPVEDKDDKSNDDSKSTAKGGDATQGDKDQKNREETKVNGKVEQKNNKDEDTRENKAQIKEDVEDNEVQVQEAPKENKAQEKETTEKNKVQEKETPEKSKVQVEKGSEELGTQIKEDSEESKVQEEQGFEESRAQEKEAPEEDKVQTERSNEQSIGHKDSEDDNKIGSMTIESNDQKEGKATIQESNQLSEDVNSNETQHNKSEDPSDKTQTNGTIEKDTIQKPQFYKKQYQPQLKRQSLTQIIVRLVVIVYALFNKFFFLLPILWPFYFFIKISLDFQKLLGFSLLTHFLNYYPVRNAVLGDINKKDKVVFLYSGEKEIAFWINFMNDGSGLSKNLDKKVNLYQGGEVRCDDLMIVEEKNQIEMFQKVVKGGYDIIPVIQQNSKTHKLNFIQSWIQSSTNIQLFEPTIYSWDVLGLLPKRKELVYIIGEPIQVCNYSNENEKEIQQLIHLYIQKCHSLKSEIEHEKLE